MKTEYKVGDIVYVIDKVNIIKSIIESITINISSKGEETTYNVYGYKSQLDPKKRVRGFNISMFVNDLETAKKSALTNLENYNKNAGEFINNLTDEMFEPKPMEKI